MERYLGLDYGDKRIGIAISDPLGLTAQGREVLVRGTAEEDLARIKEIIRDAGVRRVIVGLPRNMDGTIGPRARLTLDFANWLADELDIPVETWDERLSTAEAENILINADLSRKKRKGVIDKLAAVLILQNYLDAKRR